MSDPLAAKLDALLEEMDRIAPEDKRRFLETLRHAMRSTGASVAQASRALRDLARGVELASATTCRTWEGRAWSVARVPRADERCEPRLRSFLENDDESDAAAPEADNWREHALRRAAGEQCDWIMPAQFLAQYCTVFFPHYGEPGRWVGCVARVVCEGCTCSIPYAEAFAAPTVGQYICKYCARLKVARIEPF